MNRTNSPTNKSINNSQKKAKQNKQKQKQIICKSLRILDYRNGKYQGYITQNKQFQRNGLGIMIDDNFTFILSQWKQNNIQGPFFIIYPDQSILYGYLSDKKIGQIICYQINNQFNMILSKNSNIVIIDLLKSKSILTLKIKQELLEEHTLINIMEMLQQDEKNKQIQKGLQLISQDSYTNVEDKYKIYQKKLSVSNIPEHLKDYQSFIMNYFQNNNKDRQNDKNQLIQILKNKQQFNVSFKKCSLTLFIKLATQNNQTKILGSMNKYQNDYQFYKKYHHSANMIQQYVKNKQPQNTQYSLNPRTRPKQCKLFLSQFHKRSITHTNQFINISYIYHIKQNIQKIQQLLNQYITNKIAQIQLQNIVHLNNSNNNNNENGKKNAQLSAMNYTLEQVQQQIYDAVKRKKQNSTGKKSYVNAYNHVLEKSMYKDKSTDNIKRQTNSKNKQKQYNFSKNNSPYILKKTYQQQQDPIIQSRLTRSKTNLNVSQVNNNKVSPVKNSSFFAKNQTTGKKYAYLDDVQDNPILTSNKKASSPAKYQGYGNMKRLTEDFQNIKRQIQLNTPNKRKSNQYNYKNDNQVYQNTSKRNTQTDYTARQRVDYTISPLSQKKVFRYLPE